ncbi:hypothetical protein OHR68_34290 [Spirillospora sp. NBC_00431]
MLRTTTTTTTALLAALILAAGCGSDDGDGGGEPAPSLAADGTDLRACQDLSCEIYVSSPVTFPIDPKYGPDKMAVTKIGPDTVTIKATGDGIELGATMDRKSPGVLNGIEVRVVKITKGAAILRVSPP